MTRTNQDRDGGIGEVLARSPGHLGIAGTADQVPELDRRRNEGVLTSEFRWHQAEQPSRGLRHPAAAQCAIPSALRLPIRAAQPSGCPTTIH